MIRAQKELSQARRALERIPGFEAYAHLAFIERLGGLTNLVFRVETTKGTFSLRLPGRGTESYIDRVAEAANTRAAAKAGVSPHVVHSGPDGVMLTAFVSGAAAMSSARFRDEEASIYRAARLLNLLHEKAPAFQGQFDLFRHVGNYARIARTLGNSLPASWEQFIAELDVVRATLASNPVPLKPCHCDPVPDNFLYTGERLWMVDWEYSGQNDPMWDLANLSLEAGFDPDHDSVLLQSYFGRAASHFDKGRMVIFKAMGDLLAALWGMVQHGYANGREDFKATSLYRFERCRSAKHSDHFSASLKAVQCGP
jgi:thiamine kinase-like enzyme